MPEHLHGWIKRDGEWVCHICGVRFGEHVGPTSPGLPSQSHVHLGDRQLAVYNVLKDGEWHDGPELTHPAVGGSEGLRRLRELREKGYRIDMRRKAKGRTTRQYKLVR
jgi:hypothetical protein